MHHDGRVDDQPGFDVAVIGPGAIGCAFAGAALQAGRRVVMAARTPFERLTVTYPDVAVDRPVDVITDPAAATPVPIVLLATKAHQTEGAANWIRALTGPGSVLVSLQNGVEHHARIDPLLGDGVTHLPAVVACPAHRTAPGVARVAGRTELHVPSGDAADRLGDVMAGSVARIECVDDWITTAWIKLLTNAANGAVGVLTRRDNRIFDDPEAAELSLTLMRETAAVGRAEGARLPDDLPERLQSIVRARAGAHASSIVVDRLNGLPTEWRERNDVVVRLAERHGIDVPVSRLVTTLIRLGEPGTPGEHRGG